MTNITRCILESADKTNLSRFFSDALWKEKAINDARVKLMNDKTRPWRRAKEITSLSLDSTLREHVGDLFEYVARHYDHSDRRYPLAHNPVTNHYGCGAVRFPVDLALYRRYEEFSAWEHYVKKCLPEATIPHDAKAKAKFQRLVESTLLQDPEFAELYGRFQTRLQLTSQLIGQAVAHELDFDVVLFDGWYLAPSVVECVRRHHKDWVSVLKKNCNLESYSFTLKDEHAQPLRLAGLQIRVEDVVPLIPRSAFKPLPIADTTYWTFTFTPRIGGLGKVRLVISFANADLTGTYVVLVTNRCDWTAQRIIVANSLLHRDCLLTTDPKALTPDKTIGEACRQQAQSLIEALILYAYDGLSNGVDAPELLSDLFAAQQPVKSRLS